MSRPACPVCEARKAAFLCQSCINAQLYDDKKQDVRKQRDELHQRLEAELEKQAIKQRQQLELWRLRRRVEAARAAQAAAERELKQELRWQAETRAAVDRRRAAAERAIHELASARAKALGSALPTQIRYQSLTLAHVTAMLAREQRMHMRALLEILPLRINAIRPAAPPPTGDDADSGGGGGAGAGGSSSAARGGSPIQITVNNLRLPEVMLPPPGGWPDPLAVSAALGYLLLLVDKVGFIVGGPLLHEALPQGSTSSVWLPGSFWDRQPRRQDHVLPLYAAGAVAGGGGGGPGGGGPGGGVATLARASGGGGGFARQGSGGGGGGFWGLALGGRSGGAGGGSDGGSGGFLGRTSSDGGAGGSGTPRAGGGPAPSRRDADAQAAFALLQRSLACFLRDKAAGSGLQLPAAWNPLAWLVVFCAVVKRDAKADGKLVAASLAADGGAPPLSPAAVQQQQQQQAQQRRQEQEQQQARASRDSLDTGSVMALLEGAGGEPPPLPPPLVTGPWDGAWAFDGEDDEEEDEGWGVVRAPFLPPPPSRPEDVEHWTRAMGITDTGGGGPSGSGGGLPGAAALLASSPGNGGMLSVEYIRQLFK